MGSLVRQTPAVSQFLTWILDQELFFCRLDVIVRSVPFVDTCVAGMSAFGNLALRAISSSIYGIQVRDDQRTELKEISRLKKMCA